MGLLFKKLMRDIWQTRGQFLSILAVITVGVMFFTGLQTGLWNLNDVSGSFFTDYRLADLTAVFYNAPESAVRYVSSLPYVKMAEGRIVKDAKTDIYGEEANVRVITLPDVKRDIPNDVLIKSGRYFSPDSLDQCLVEEEFFKAHDLKLGDYIYPVINGKKTALRITGAVKTPEYIYLVRDSSEFSPNPKGFGLIFIKKSLGQSLYGYTDSVNEITLLLDAGADAPAAKRQLEKELEKYDVVRVVEKDDQLSYSTFTKETESLSSFGKVLPLIFFAVAALIIYITMTRLIENQRGQMGVLMALGYSNVRIYSHYLSYASIVGIIGSITGTAAGTFAGAYLLWVYNTIYKLPYSGIKIYPVLVFPAALISLLFCVVSSYSSCRSVLSTIPAQALRPKAPVSGKKTLVEKAGPLWNALNFSWKMILRNLFRYRRRTALTCIGIIFSFGLLLCGLGMDDTLNRLVTMQYPDSQEYDLKLSFTGFVSTDELESLESLPHVKKVEPVLELGVEIRKGWAKKDIALTMLVGDSELYGVIDAAADNVKLPYSGILVPEKLAGRLGIEKGDRVDIRLLLPGKDKEYVGMPVRGYRTQYVGESAAADISGAVRLLEEGRIMNGAVLKLDKISSEAYVVEKLEDMSNVDAVISKQKSKENLMKGLANMTSMITFIYISAGVLALAVIYNITTINIFERRREIATLKVLGFNEKEMRQIVFNENIIITLAGIIGGLPVGYWLLDFIMTVSSTDTMTFPVMIKWPSYIISALLTMCFTILTNLLLTRKLETIDMVESLKSAE